MSTTTDTDELLRLAATVCPAHEGLAPTGTPAPYAALHGGQGIPTGRHLDGGAYRETVHRLVAVSNNKRGCRILTNRLVAAIDGQPHDRGCFVVAHVADPLSDPDGGSNSWWSCTIEIRHHIRS